LKEGLLGMFGEGESAILRRMRTKWRKKRLEVMFDEKERSEKAKARGDDIYSFWTYCQKDLLSVDVRRCGPIVERRH